MSGLTAIFLLVIAQPCPGCEASSTGAQMTTPQSQYEGLAKVVADLREQIKKLGDDYHRKQWYVDNLNADEQVAVIDLADSMVDNLLLTRTYLSLAVAELKLISVGEKAGALDEKSRSRFLRHIEAIQLGIDERILEPQDLRVYRVLQAGVNQALRLELQRLATQSYSSCQTTCVWQKRARRCRVLSCR